MFLSAHLTVLDSLGEQESEGGQADLLLAPGEGLVKDGGLRSENGRNKAGVSIHTLSYCHNKHKFSFLQQNIQMKWFNIRQIDVLPQYTGLGNI